MSSSRTITLPSSLVLLSLAVAASATVGCGSSKSEPPTSSAAAVAGPVDVHCTDNGVEIKRAIGMCVVDEAGTSSALSADDGGADAASADGSTDGAADDAGSSGADGGTDDGGDGGGAPPSDFGPTLYNAEGDDDDCKYHVSWTSTDVKENVSVTFHVKVIRRSDGRPATGANVALDVTIDSHPTPSTEIPSKESAGGSYKVGPVVFDQPGVWTVRFHFYETCSDLRADSPHGHAAFRVNVP